MFHFTTNQNDTLTPLMTRPLLILSPEGQFLARYDAPSIGWTYLALCQMNTVFEPAWSFCGADAFLGDEKIGSCAPCPSHT